MCKLGKLTKVEFRCKLICLKILSLKGVLWTSKKLSETSPGSQTYTAHMEPTDGKWTAFFVDLQYEKQEEASEGRGSLGWPYNNQHFEFTTAVSIIPNTYPYPECYGDSCFGKLV